MSACLAAIPSKSQLNRRRDLPGGQWGPQNLFCVGGFSLFAQHKLQLVWLILEFLYWEHPKYFVQRKLRYLGSAHYLYTFFNFFFAKFLHFLQLLTPESDNLQLLPKYLCVCNFDWIFATFAEFLATFDPFFYRLNFPMSLAMRLTL